MSVRAFFEEQYRKFGAGPKALDWSEEGQRRRFRVLSEVGDMSGKSVADLGCGFGDLLDSVEERFEGMRYTGFDFSQAILSEARRRHANAKFDELDVLRDPL